LRKQQSARPADYYFGNKVAHVRQLKHREQRGAGNSS
jgi:hypothetical protein